MITLSVSDRTLRLEVADEVLAARADEVVERPKPRRGYAKLYADEVTQAEEGCDFRFLQDPDPTTPVPGRVPGPVAGAN